MLHGWWIDDSEALELPGRLEQPIAVARPDGVPPGRVGFRVSRDLASVSCVSRSLRDSSGDVSCVSRSSPGAHGDVFVCEQILDEGCIEVCFMGSIDNQND